MSDTLLPTNKLKDSIDVVVDHYVNALVDSLIQTVELSTTAEEAFSFLGSRLDPDADEGVSDVVYEVVESLRLSISTMATTVYTLHRQLAHNQRVSDLALYTDALVQSYDRFVLDLSVSESLAYSTLSTSTIPLFLTWKQELETFYKEPEFII